AWPVTLWFYGCLLSSRSFVPPPMPSSLTCASQTLGWQASATPCLLLQTSMAAGSLATTAARCSEGLSTHTHTRTHARTHAHTKTVTLSSSRFISIMCLHFLVPSTEK